MPAPAATRRLAVRNQPIAPTAAPVPRAPSLRPMTLLRMRPRIGTPTKRKIAMSCQSKPTRPRGLDGEVCADGAGSFSPAMSAPSRSTAVLRPPAKSPALNAGRICSRMMRPVVTSGIAPCSVAATWMSTSRSFLATAIRRPSPTSFLPNFQLEATRCANEAMSSGRAVGTIRTTICAPLLVSIAASLALSASACAGVSVDVWSMTRPVRIGTGTTSSASAGPRAFAASSAAAARTARIGRLAVSATRACRSSPAAAPRSALRWRP